MSYDVIDPVILAWCAQRELQLFTSGSEGRPARFCYSSSSKNECFQIAIAPPTTDQGGMTEVTVHVWPVETLDDAEFHYAWTAPVWDLEAALEAAWTKVEELKRGEARRVGEG